MNGAALAFQFHHITVLSCHFSRARAYNFVPDFVNKKWPSDVRSYNHHRSFACLLSSPCVHPWESVFTVWAFMQLIPKYRHFQVLWWQTKQLMSLLARANLNIFVVAGCILNVCLLVWHLQKHCLASFKIVKISCNCSTPFYLGSDKSVVEKKKSGTLEACLRVEMRKQHVLFRALQSSMSNSRTVVNCRNMFSGAIVSS